MGQILAIVCRCQGSSGRLTEVGEKTGCRCDISSTSTQLDREQYKLEKTGCHPRCSPGSPKFSQVTPRWPESPSDAPHTAISRPTVTWKLHNPSSPPSSHHHPFPPFYSPARPPRNRWVISALPPDTRNCSTNPPETSAAHILLVIQPRVNRCDSAKMLVNCFDIESFDV